MRHVVACEMVPACEQVSHDVSPRAFTTTAELPVLSDGKGLNEEVVVEVFDNELDRKPWFRRGFWSCGDGSHLLRRYRQGVDPSPLYAPVVAYVHEGHEDLPVEPTVYAKLLYLFASSWISKEGCE